MHARRWILGCAATLGAAFICTAAAAAAADDVACRAAAPAEFAGQAARWLGPCPGGAADGAGVMRVGTAEPYQFFLGDMKAGRPMRGLMITSTGLEPVEQFDSGLNNATSRSMEGSTSDSLFDLAVNAAHLTAKRFTAAGNRGSAAYYERLAKRVRDSQPE
ncbi:hypothetical protein G3N92_02990 [Burkholderia sp. Ac-20379]|nr:hypothetical protein [Burkholderia sp. Ac-20379]MBN3723152.1 hypothetical protein [Burkholderia sp. Ac-20379]